MRGFSFVPNTTPLAIARSLPLPVRSVSLIAAKRGSIIWFGHKKHDPKKWEPVFRKDHAQTKKCDHDPIHLIGS
jgi:hypothetical protein